MSPSQQAVLLLFGFVLSLNFLALDAATNKPFVYERNGVRLVGGDATKGRLEVLPSPYPVWITDDWIPVCIDYSTSDALAQIMCQALGYKYGRRYYSPGLSFPVNASGIMAGDMDCWENSDNDNSGHRRLLRGGMTTTAAAASRPDIGTQDSSSSSGGGGDGDGQAMIRNGGRSLLSPLSGFVAFPETMPYRCRFRVGTCNPAGPMMAVQCSNKAFPPAPPPPPSPPSPPPPPPAISNLIRVVGGVYRADAPLEPNLCIGDRAEQLCGDYARIEMQIDSPNKKAPGKIWAPVCNITNATLAASVADLACDQRFQERLLPWLPNAWYIWPELSSTPFFAPKGTVTSPNDFNPKNFKGWVTITGWSSSTSSATKLQDLKYKVSTSGCSRGAMLAIGCSQASNDGAIP